MCLGIPGKLIEIHAPGDLPMGKVEFGGIVKDICLAYTPEAQPGDYVLVHVGFAISRIDEAEAQEIFHYLEEIGDAMEEENVPYGNDECRNQNDEGMTNAETPIPNP
jgi:hydrogenase expression/formation protein HypC